MLTLAAVLGLASCSKEGADHGSVENASVPEQVLATVNGEPITESDVDRMINRTISPAQQTLIDNNLRDKILDSLIASKAMKQLISKELSAEKIAQLEAMVKSYQEELYVKEYLLQYANAKPVSTQMVQNYYCLLYTSPSPRDQRGSRMPSSA